MSPHRCSLSRKLLRLAAVTCVAAAVLAQTAGAQAKPKDLAKGLMTVGVRPYDWPNLIDVWVPTLYWKDLEPRPGVLRHAPIDDLIAKARAAGNVLRVRIFAGRGAPDWVMQRFGTVSVYDPIDGINATVPRWWVHGYMDVYRRFQALLAERYDGNATIRSVTVSGAMTVYAEPFIRGTSASVTRASLLAAGYTPRKDRHALLESIDAQRPWHRTRQILALNPWQYVRTDGTYGFSTAFTNHVMDRFRATFGGRAILQNNSIRASWITDGMPAGYAGMFSHMEALGGPISFETATSYRVGDLATVLKWCVAKGAHGVELQRDATSQLTYDQASTFDQELQANG